MTIVINHNQQQYRKAGKPLQDKVNDFFQLLIGAADKSNEFASLQGLVLDLNRGCDTIFRVGGAVLKTTANFIAGEPDQNARSRGESPHTQNTSSD